MVNVHYISRIEYEKYAYLQGINIYTALYITFNPRVTLEINLRTT